MTSEKNYKLSIETLKKICEFLKESIEANILLSKENLNDEEINKILSVKPAQDIDFNTFPADLLADYIEKKHHRYIEDKTPVLQQYLDKLCKVHGEQHPELLEIRKIFNESAQAMAAHMKKEELVLFPYIRKLELSIRKNNAVASPHFGTVSNPVRMMMDDHDTEGERFRAIAALSNNYNPPVDACGTYRVTYSMLKEYEEDLHLHIHLENNILFPRAIEIENSLTKQIHNN